MNMGTGYGYKVCYDCIGKAGCRDWCTCLSQCICCRCQTVADLRAAAAPHRVRRAPGRDRLGSASLRRPGRRPLAAANGFAKAYSP